MLFETGANHSKGIEAVGGMLYLTNQRLVFESHQFNIQNHQLSLKLVEIKKVDRFKSLGLINNGLSITTTANVVEKFAVEQPEQWVSKLSKG